MDSTAAASTFQRHSSGDAVVASPSSSTDWVGNRDSRRPVAKQEEESSCGSIRSSHGEDTTISGPSWRDTSLLWKNEQPPQHEGMPTAVLRSTTPQSNLPPSPEARCSTASTSSSTSSWSSGSESLPAHSLVLAPQQPSHQQQPGGTLYDVEYPTTTTCSSSSSTWEIPRKLYHRDIETALLLDALERCCFSSNNSNHPRELILVTGSSGNGKTFLVETALRQAVIQRGGMFLSGKFDLLERQESYYPLIQAICQWVEQILVSSAAYFHEIQERLWPCRETIRVLMDLVPAMSKIFDTDVRRDNTIDSKLEPQSREATPGAASRERLKLALHQFLRAICSKSHPIALFWDDLQWAEPASLDLLASLLEDDNSATCAIPPIPGLLLIGACRDNELTSHAHLSVLLRELEANHVTITQVPLDNVHPEAFASWITNAWNMSSVSQSQRLSQLVWEQTGGNLFVAIQLLRTMVEEQLLYPIHPTKDGDSTTPWCLQSDTRIQPLLRWIGKTATQLLAFRIQQQDPLVQQTIVVASCLGAEFPQLLLETAVSFDVQQSLQIARSKGFLEPILSTIRTLENSLTSCSSMNSNDTEGEQGALVWRFGHDQIQQSAYSLLPEHEREQVHLQIGRKLWTSLTEDQLDRYANVVVKQLRLGARLMTDEVEREQMAILLLRAGESASKSAAHLTAREYLALGMQLLTKRHWRDQYELALGLYNAATEVEYCLGNYHRMDEFVDEILPNARSNKDKIRALTARVYSLGSRNQLQEAIDVGLLTLKRYCGESFPSKPSMFHICVELIRTKRMLRKLSDDDLLSLPLMTGQQQLAAMRILCLLFPYTLNGRPLLGPLISMRLVQRSLTRGISGMSSVAFSTFGMLLCIAFQDVELGIRYGKASLQMLKKFDAKEWLPRVYSAVYGFCLPYKEPMHDQLKPLLLSHRVGLGGGDIEFSMLSAAAYTSVSIFSSVRLSSLSVDVHEFLSLTEVYHQVNMAQFLRPNVQFIDNLRGCCKDPTILDGEALDLDLAVREATQTKNTTVMTIILLCELLLASYFNRYEDAEALSTRLLRYGMDSFPCFCKAAVWLHEGIAILSGPRSRGRIRKVRRNLKQLEKLSSYSNFNVSNKVSLLTAELAVASGHFHQAQLYFEDAISHGRVAKNWSDAGLACERAARALRKRGRLDDAVAYLNQAANAYELWGATAKVATIRAREQSECAFTPCSRQ